MRAIPLDRLVSSHVSMVRTVHADRSCVRLEEAAPATDGEASLAWAPDVTFTDGTIEALLAGAPRADAPPDMRGFVGIAFRVQTLQRYECFFLRPTNGRADDQVRRNHATQYMAPPDHPWNVLRASDPGRYESYVDLVPDAWTRVRIEVQGDRARLYVHDAPQPCLVVNDLKHGRSEGGIGVWIGSGTRAHVAELRVG